MATLCRWSRVAKRREAWFESGFGQSINQNRNKLNICNGHQSVYGDGKHGNAYDDGDDDDDDDDGDDDDDDDGENKVICYCHQWNIALTTLSSTDVHNIVTILI